VNNSYEKAICKPENICGGGSLRTTPLSQDNGVLQAIYYLKPAAAVRLIG